MVNTRISYRSNKFLVHQSSYSVLIVHKHRLIFCKCRCNDSDVHIKCNIYVIHVYPDVQIYTIIHDCYGCPNILHF